MSIQKQSLKNKKGVTPKLSFFVTPISIVVMEQLLYFSTIVKLVIVALPVPFTHPPTATTALSLCT